MQKLLRVLRFFRLTDEADNLSLTNIAVLAGIINMFFLQEVSLEGIGIFVGSLVSYQAKRLIQPKNNSDKEEIKVLQDALAKLQTDVTALHIGRTIKR